MKILFYIFTLFMLFVPEINSERSRNDSVILARRKRYVAFPDGSTMIFAFCMTQRTILPMQIFTEGVNWGVAYELPNRTTFTDYIANKKNKSMLKRRHRRDLYDKIEIIMDSMGFNGRACIFRALCEASRFKPEKPTLSEEILRMLFKFPQQTLLDSEPEEHRLYHWAYRWGKENKQQDCSSMFPACSISLIDLALGYYNDYTEEHHYQTSTINR